MTQMNCIIVDDDMMSTKFMSGLVNRTEAAALERTFSNAIDAVNYLSRPESESVNLIFLDIEMPEMSGIEFLRSVDLTGKEVVIYSSQEKYALESYEYDVCDYLLKPVSYARFIKAVAKARAAYDSKSAPAPQDGVEATSDETTIFLKDNTGQVHKIAFDEIVLIEAMENYVNVLTPKMKIMVHIPMKKLVEAMPENAVARVHRSYAVGLRFIIHASGENIDVEYEGNKKSIPVSRTYKADVKKLLKDASQWGGL